jgi:cupin fold WbuC family metalloprotein
MTHVQLLDDALIARLLDAARESPRRRRNHDFHAGPADNPHRFLNVMLRDTYVRPHRHVTPPKSEAFLVLEGAVAVFLFDDEGRVSARHDLGVGGVRGIDLAPGLWHTLVPLSEHVVIYEVKPGPWDPSTDKEMAPWAPAEGDADAAVYARALLASGEP